MSPVAARQRIAVVVALIALATAGCIKFDSAGVMAVRNRSGVPIRVVLDYNNDGEGHEARIRPGAIRTITKAACGVGTFIVERMDGTRLRTVRRHSCPGDHLSIDSRGRITSFD